MHKLFYSILLANSLAAASAHAESISRIQTDFVSSLPVTTKLIAKQHMVLPPFKTRLISAIEGPDKSDFGDWCAFDFPMASEQRNFGGTVFMIQAMASVNVPPSNFPGPYFEHLTLIYINSKNKESIVHGNCMRKIAHGDGYPEITPATLGALQKGFKIVTP